jgi:hypothetical protein
MPPTFDLSAESLASVDEVHSAFGDQDYCQVRLAAFGVGPGAAMLDSLIIDAAGTVEVATTFDLFRDRLPGLVHQLHRGDLALLHTPDGRRPDRKVDERSTRGRNRGYPTLHHGVDL